MKLNFVYRVLALIILSTIPGDATRCYLCMFHLAHCTNPLDCYNQPDVCSNTNFSPVLTQVVECEYGCEQYVVTDATGEFSSQCQDLTCFYCYLGTTLVNNSVY